MQNVTHRAAVAGWIRCFAGRIIDLQLIDLSMINFEVNAIQLQLAILSILMCLHPRQISK